MIVDVHVHVYPPQIIKEAKKIAEKEDYFALLISSKVHRFATAEDVIAYMDRFGIKSCVVFGFAFFDQGLCRLCNDYVAESCARYKGRLIPCGVVNPLARGVIKEIDRLKDMGFVGIGELFPEAVGWDITDVYQTFRIVGAVHERNMFLSIHVAEPVGHNYPGKGRVSVKEAASFVMNHPEVKVIWPHLGGGLFLYESMPEMKRYLRNSYYDTAALPFLYSADILLSAFLIESVSDKFLYGSDFPILDYERYKKAFDKLPPKDLEKLLYANFFSNF